MYYATLADGTKFVLNQAYSLNNLIYIAENQNEALRISRSLTKDKLSHVEFSQENGAVYGTFENLMLKTPPVRQDAEDGKVKVIISLRPATDIELRLMELEETQMIQDMAIDDLANAISEE